MDCRTARHFLDCLHDGSIVPADESIHETLSVGELADHLEHCHACQLVRDEWRHFDRRMFSMLMSSPLPPGLEQRLLDAVEAEIAPPLPSVHIHRRTFLSRWKMLTGIAALLLAAGSWWAWHVQEPPLNYTGAGQLLAARFLKSDAGWQDLDKFDGSFELGSYHNDLGQFQLSAAHGIDLGGGRGQDAAVFQFGLKNWGGIITVLPTQHFTGVPDISTPNVQSNRSILQWRSSDGKLTYICFVHRGSAAALAHEIFGLLT